MERSGKEFRRKTFFELEKERFGNGVSTGDNSLLSGIEFEYRYLFEEFKYELFKKISYDPFMYDRYRWEIKTVDEYIKNEKNSWEKRRKYYEKSDKLELLKKNIDEWEGDFDIDEWSEYLDNLTNDDIIRKANEFKINLFKYIDLHLKTSIIIREKRELVSYCRDVILNYSNFLWIINDEIKKKFSKKVKNELNSISMEIFNRFNELKNKIN